MVVDDHPVFADALKMRLSAEPDLEPVLVAYSVKEAILRFRRASADVAILDHMLGDGTGTELAQELLRTSPGTRVVILSAVEDVGTVIDALAVGARAWLPKTIDTDRLIEVIRSVHAGGAWLDPMLLGEVLTSLVSQANRPQDDPLAALTIREREVLDFLVKGTSRSEIAAKLGVSSHTVRTHTQNLIAKLGAHSVLEAVAFARRAGQNAASSMHPYGNSLPPESQ